MKGTSHTVPKSAPNFGPLRDALIAGQWDRVPDLLTVKKSLENWARGEFTIDGSTITYKGDKLPADLTRRILDLSAKGEDPKAFFMFWERLQQNPSYRSVEQLWPFLSHKGIPLTTDGCFLAYKGVRIDYKDAHSGTFDNRPGNIHEMPRNKISDDPRTACHEGFHVGALGYAKSFSARTVVCKVDPKDVVCVPYDHSQQKMRVCRYKVIGNFGAKLPDDLWDEDFKLPEGSEFEPEAKTDDAGTASVGSTSGAPVAVTSAPTAKAKKEEPSARYKELDKMDLASLMEVGIMELRTYASQHLNIIGASKIPGGKVMLVQAIMQTRWDG